MGGRGNRRKEEGRTEKLKGRKCISGEEYINVKQSYIIDI